MELTAVIKGLEKYNELGYNSNVKIYTDSAYVKNGITKWIHTWVLNGWRTSQGQEVKNRALWESLYDITKTIQVEWFWVKAHNGDPLNEQVDKLARSSAANNI
jgi:ribonuclease HI